MAEAAKNSSPGVGGSVGSGVSDDRLARLRRGVNLSHWFAQAKHYTQAHLEGYVTDQDAALIAGAGFDHVRLSLEPDLLSAPPAEVAQTLVQLGAALERFLSVGVAVIVDLHPQDDFKLQLQDSDAAVERCAELWRALAAWLTRYDPAWVFLELLNEPVMSDAARWQHIQRRLVAAVRAAAPEHTLIATAQRWSSVSELLTLEPLADANLIYTFHCYDPHLFTHQGASWSMAVLPFLSQLPYPSSPEAVRPLLPQITDADAREAARVYGEARWDAAKLDALIAQAAAWAARHRVPLSCTEFGVYRAHSAPEHRTAWLRDLTRSLERRGVGWTMWDYAGGFSAALPRAAHDFREATYPRHLDPDTLAALGLEPAAAR